MIEKIKIRNFKSIVDLSLTLGRVTVLIGENGSGKSNILEAIAFAAAASSNKLDNEFLYNRGIRVTDNDWMTSAFKTQVGPHTIREPINISVSAKDDESPLNFVLRRDEKDKWGMSFSVSEDEWKHVLTEPEFRSELEGHLEEWNRKDIFKTDKIQQPANKELLRKIAAYLVVAAKKGKETPIQAAKMALRDFIIYAPENTVLRRFDDAGAIKPLGTKGEGLLKLLQMQASTEKDGFSAELNSHLHLLGWFDALYLPTAADEIQGRLQIRDRWLPNEGPLFDQRSANEGFLYLLFYFTVLLSQETPKFLAIDNIDNALNPRLSAEMMRQLITIAKKSGKQVICTTHNPAILDGLNLEDPEQRLVVVRRNSHGYTTIKRVQAPQPMQNEPAVRLSEAFIRGIIGGVPDHF